MSQPPIRIALVDDHPLVLDGLERLFRLEPDFVIVARCRDGEEALRLLRETPVDLLLLDVRLPGLDGFAVLEAIGEGGFGTRVLLLTAALEPEQVARAIALRARGIVLKEVAPELVVEAARRIHGGGVWFDPAHLGQAADAMRAAVVGGAPAARLLTPREREIAAMVAAGARNRAIAERLGISVGTVKLHLHHVYEKLGVDGRLGLVLFAQRNAL